MHVQDMVFVFLNKLSVTVTFLIIITDKNTAAHLGGKSLFQQHTEYPKASEEVLSGANKDP